MNETPNRPREEKEEKDEKRHEKEEKERGDPLSTAVWGAIIVWAGLVFLADNLGILGGVRGGIPGIFLFRLEAWALIFLGAGVILILEAVVRTLVPTYRRAITGTVILAIVFIGIGLGNLIGWNVIWPLVLIGIGAFILLRGLAWRQ